MSYTMDSAPVPFMASRPAAAVERPREEPPTAHAPLTTPSAAPVPIGSATLPPFGSDAMRKPDGATETRSPFEPARLARAPEPPKPAVTSLPKPDGNENGARLPSIANLDAPAEPPKPTIPGLFGVGPAASILNNPVDAAAAAAPVSGGLAPPSLPKPVEVNSVPDTPTNIGTPPGGNHRPELNIMQEPIKKPEPAAATATSVPETEKPAAAPSVNGSSTKATEESSPAPIPAPPAPTPAVAPASSIPGLSASGSSLKRKLEDQVGKDGAPEDPATEQQAEKKAKVEAEAPKPAAANADKPTVAAPVSEVPKEAAADKTAEPSAVPETAKEATAAEPAATPTTTPKKAGRPKKDKKAAPPVGRAQRKTRSQGPAEGSL